MGLPAAVVSVGSQPLTQTQIQGIFHDTSWLPPPYLATPGKNDSGDSGLLMSSSGTEDATSFMKHFKVGTLALAFPQAFNEVKVMMFVIS